MLSILNAYIIRRTAVFIAIVILAIGGLLLVMGTADEVSRRGNDSYGLIDALLYQLFGLPLEVYQYIGPMVLLGTLLSVAGLAKNSELVIIQFASTSAHGLVLRLLLPGLLLLPVIYGIGEWAGPRLNQQAEQIRALKLERSLPTLSGEWYQDNEWIINVDFVSPEREITGLTVFEMAGNSLARVLYAPKATPIEGGWRLSQVRQVSFEQDSVHHSQHETLDWEPANVNADLLGILSQRSSELTLTQLSQQLAFARQTNRPDPELALTFWNRLWFPVLYLGMLFLALVFSLGSFRQRTLGDAAFKGVAAAIGLQLIIETGASLLLVAGLPAPLAALLPMLAFLSITATLVARRL